MRQDWLNSPGVRAESAGRPQIAFGERVPDLYRLLDHSGAAQTGNSSMTDKPIVRNVADELARERNREAAERTLMASDSHRAFVDRLRVRHRQARSLP